MPPPLQVRSALSTLPLASSPYLPTTATTSRPRFIISTNSKSTTTTTSSRAAASTRTKFPQASSSSSSVSSTDHSSIQSKKSSSSSQKRQHEVDIKSTTDPRIISLPPTLSLSSSSSSHSPSSSYSTTTTTLPWNQYLQLRKTRRYYNLAASACTSFVTTAAGISILSQQDLEVLGGTVPGLDPFLLLGLATAGSGAVGWLLGPFVGNAVFGLSHRKLGAQIAAHPLLDTYVQKDKDFYRRIKQYRVDPSSQSYSNPVPDYYGEKIGSVGEFRNWMKDQRAYNKKRQNFL